MVTTYDTWTTTPPDDGEPEQEDPRVDCGICGTAFDPATWPDCSECDYERQTAREDD